MSQTRWKSHFKAATYGPVVDAAVDPSRTILSQGDIAAGDLVGHEVRHYLRQDPILRRIFGTRFDFMPWRNPFDFRAFPRLQVYLAANINSERPTAVSVEELSVYVGTRWDAQEAEPVEDGEPTIVTVLAHVKRVLRSSPARSLVVHVDGEQRILGTNMKVEGERYVVDVIGKRQAFVHEIQFTWRLDLDRSTVQIINLQ